MNYVLIKSDSKGIKEVLLSGSKPKLEKARDLILDKNNKRNYTVSYKLTIWKVTSTL
jgi:hypothetical protein